MNRPLLCSIGLGLLLALPLAGAGALAQVLYTATPIQQEKEARIEASQLNNQGQVAGYLRGKDGQPRAFVTGENGLGMTVFDISEDTSSLTVYGLNDAGQIVGQMAAGGFLGQPGGGALQPLSELFNGKSIGAAFSINNLGQIVAYNGGATEGLVLDVTTGNVQTLADWGARMTPTDINDEGVVVGSGHVTGPRVGRDLAFVSEPPYTQSVPLHNVKLATQSTAMAVNRQGRIVGRYLLRGTGTSRAFAAEPGSTLRDLNLPRDAHTWAVDINDDGVILGKIDYLHTPEIDGFICSGDCSDVLKLTPVTALPEGVRITNVQHINNRGQILVYGSDELYYLLTRVD
ncbi:DUF3466 family protein [Ideonella azotifigens]|uniref:HAF repeat-containing protein n=1 Tax=Ideonella azotifigens TaxID=513160 RepID=A0ABP3VAJ7_9BURK|nr:hypothetical protein [Ideonella azotifigens]MCD2343818.1 DUF3466 family protein [Ideonella azotifigens]